MKNSQLSIEKNIYVKFVESFSGLFCISITWHYGNLKAKLFFWWYPLKYIQNKWKTSLKLKLFLTKRWRLKHSERSTPKIAISYVFVISGGNILYDKAQEIFPFGFPGRVPVIFQWIFQSLCNSSFIEEIFNINNWKKHLTWVFFCNSMNPLILERKFSRP